MFSCKTADFCPVVSARHSLFHSDLMYRPLITLKYFNHAWLYYAFPPVAFPISLINKNIMTQRPHLKNVKKIGYSVREEPRLCRDVVECIKHVNQRFHVQCRMEAHSFLMTGSAHAAYLLYQRDAVEVSHRITPARHQINV